MKTKFYFAIAILSILSFSFAAFAQSPPRANFLYDLNADTISAQSFLVTDKATGQVLAAKNPQNAHVPASLTKVMTALVVLESGADLERPIAITAQDEVGGMRIRTRPGIKYRASDLLRASLIASANNATNALVRATGLSVAGFVAKMNEKAQELGARQTVFVEPTGISPKNITTAEDFTKIAAAAFAHPTIRSITQMPKFTLRSTNNRRYVHNLKNTNQILNDRGWLITAAKTGFLNESRYNFAAEMRDVDGKDILVVLLGSKSQTAKFEEAKYLALWSWLNYIWPKGGAQVAGLRVSIGNK